MEGREAIKPLPGDEVEGYPGKRKRHKITQFVSHTKTWSEKQHAAAYYITPRQ